MRDLVSFSLFKIRATCKDLVIFSPFQIHDARLTAKLFLIFLSATRYQIHRSRYVRDAGLTVKSLLNFSEHDLVSFLSFETCIACRVYDATIFEFF